MLLSNELRWFYPGKLPEDIQLWFQQNCLIDPLKSPEEREDVYLYSPECNYLGIKLRQRRLEVKWRQAELGAMYCSELATGKAEKWGKWLCEDSKGESFQPTTVLGKPSWVSVQKVRYSQLFQVFANFSVQAVATNERINNGCSVEITNLVVQENDWWSLAFEAFGEDSRIKENLQATASWVFDTYQNSQLVIADSYAYPHWLGLICH
jgi:hypothetical protein